MGNICRSPLAEGIMRQKTVDRGLDWEVDSCGTDDYHAGEAPCEGAQKIAEKHGIDISGNVSRKLRSSDLQFYDLILVMDAGNYSEVMRLVRSETETKKVKMILDYSYPGEGREVPDPFWSNSGFENVYSLLEEACEKVIEAVQET